ncbi:MAG: S8 family serine peptidase [Candidatus Falkowbacteria bacterium]
MRILKTSFSARSGPALGWFSLFLTCFALTGLFFFITAVESAQALLPNDSEFSQQWYLQRINAQKAWDIQYASPQIVIAVLDTGVDIDHPDLNSNIWINQDEIPDNGLDDDRNGYIDDYQGWDFFNNMADPRPKFTEGFTEVGIHHGTLVAGIASASGNNAFGVSGLTWQAQIMPLKVLSDSGEGRVVDVIKAIDYATNNGAHIINLSFVGIGFSDSLQEAIQRAYNAGIIIVAAAGNENEQGEGESLDKNKMYPVCYDGSKNMVIGVAATDAIDQKAIFSNYGFSCIDISAPGTGIFGLATYDLKQRKNGDVFDKYYQGYWSGTSMATSIVSGSLALIKTVNPKLSRDQLIEILLSTADDINRVNPHYLRQLGSGRLNLQKAVEKAYQELVNFNDLIITAPQSATTSAVQIFNTNNTALNKFNAYTDNFLGGANIASGDIDGDGIDEIITGAGPGGGPHVRIFDSAGNVKGQFFAYHQNFRGGVNIAVGDIDGDGANEIITGPGKGGIAEIKIFDNKLRIRKSFIAYHQNFRGGVQVAIGDTNGDGIEEIVTGTGLGGGPHVRIFDKRGNVKGQFFAYDKNFRGGVNIGLGDINQDGIDEIITGAGPGGGPHVRAFNARGILLNGFYAYDKLIKGGVNVSSISIKMRE